MSRNKNFFTFELLRKRKLISYSIIVGLLLIIGILVVGIIKNADIDSAKNIYNIPEYENFDELNEHIVNAEIALREEKKEYEKAISTDVSENILHEKSLSIKALETMIKAMRELYSRNIVYEKAVEYRSFEKTNSASVLISLIIIVSVIVNFCFVLKASTIIPKEIREGQYKITFTTCSRIKYILSKYAIELIRCTFLILISTLLLMAICAVFYPNFDSYVICATSRKAFAVSLIPAAFMQLAISILQMLLSSLISLAISLFVGKMFEISSLFSVFICFSGYIVEPIRKMMGYELNFIKWLFPSNILLIRSWFDVSANSFLVNFLLSFFTVLIVLVASLILFRKRDIK